MKRAVRPHRPFGRPFHKSSRWPRPLAVSLTRLGSVAAVCGALCAGVGPARAATTLNWDADGSAANDSTAVTFLGGTGFWNTSANLWWDGVAASGADSLWSNGLGDTAVFGGSAGVVTLGTPISVGTILFNTAGFNLMGTGANGLTLGGTAFPGSGKIQVENTGVDTISAPISGNNGLTLSSTMGGTLALTGANSYTGGITIGSGTLSVLSEAGLGDVGNGLTFNGGSGGLTLNAPIVLGAGRQIVLNNTAAVSLTSAAAGSQVVLGQISGAGALNVVNTGTTYFLNSGNNFTGSLGIQNGTVSLTTLLDSAGSGNIRLGATAAGTFQWAPGASGPLVLTNRQFELAGTTTGGTIDSSAAGAITINSDLLVSGIGAKTLTLQGFNTGTNTFAGAIGDSASGATALTKTGPAIWVLSGTSSFTGNISVPVGVLRVTSAGGLGGTGTFSFDVAANGQGIELRVDGSNSFNRSLVANKSTGNAFIVVDHAVGGTTTGGTQTIGNVNQANSTAGFGVVGDHSYSLTTGTLLEKGALTFNLSNDLGAPGFSAPGYQAGILTVGGIMSDATAGTATQTLGGWGDIVVGPVVSTSAGTPLNITKGGSGLLTFTTANSGWTSGVLTTNAGTLRAGGALTGGATLNLGAGLVELRNDASTNFGFSVSNVSGAATLVVDHSLTGTTSGQVATIGTLLDTSTNTLNVVGDHGYGLATGTVTLGTGVTFTVNNLLSALGYAAPGYTPGVINFGGVTNASGVTGTLVLAGFGDYATFGSGTVFNTGGGTLNLTKNALGVQTFTGDNSGWTSGTLTAGAGVTRLLSSSALGTATLTLGTGLAELRADSATNFAGIAAAGGTLAIGHTTGAAGVLGQTLSVGSITAGAAQTMNLVGDNGYNFGVTGTTTVVNTFTLTLNNYLAAPGYGGAGYTPGVVSLAAVTNSAAGGTGTLALAGYGDYGFNGGLSNTGAGGILNVNKTGLGVATFTGTSPLTAGTLSTTGGVSRILSSGALGTGGTLSLGTTGLTELRADTATTFAGIASAAGTLLIGHGVASTGVSGQTISVSSIAAPTTAAMTLIGDNGYSFSTAAVTITGAAALTLNNFLAAPGYSGAGYTPGSVTFSTVTNAATGGTGTLALAGFGDYSFTGGLASTGTSGILNINKTGLGVATFTGSSGGLTAGTLNTTGGVSRILSSGALGTGTLTLGTGLTELRADGPATFANIAGAGGTLAIGHGTASTGVTPQTLSVGTITVPAAQTMNIVGDNGYSFSTTGAVTIANGFIFTLNNYLAAPGYGGASYTPGTVAPGLVTNSAAGGTGTLTLGGFGDTAFASGSVASTGALGLLTINKGGFGVATFSGSNTNWVGGTLNTTAGTTRVEAGTGSSAVLGTANLGVGGGLTEVRSNGGATFAGNVTLSASGVLNADPSPGNSSVSNSLSFGGLTVLATGQTLTFDSNHAYGVSFTNAATSALAAATFTNVGGGLVTFGGGLSSSAATTWAFSGPGDFSIGNISASAGANAFTKNGLGTVTLTGTNSFTGTIAISSGVLRVANAGALGGATSTISINSANPAPLGVAALDLRNDGSMDLSQHNFTTNSFNVLVNADRAVGSVAGSSNKVMMIGGGILASANGWGWAVTGANGYSLQFGSAANTTAVQEATGVAAWTITNFIPSVAGSGGIIFNSGLTFNAVAAASGFVLGGTGDYLLSGKITNTGATAVSTLTKSGIGTLTLSGDNSTSFNIAANSVLTLSGGIARPTTGNSLGGASTTVNLSALADLDLRSNGALTFANTTIALGAAALATINVDAALGSTGSTGTTHVLNGVKGNAALSSVFLTGGTQSGANAYNLGVTTFTVGITATAALPTLINSLGNSGVLNIGTLTAANFGAILNGASDTNITTAMTLGTGALTKSGAGTLTIKGATAGNTSGAITINGGTLALDYSAGAAAALLPATAGVTMGSGNFTVTGVSGASTTTQTLTSLTLAAGQENITINPNGGAGTTLSFSGALSAAVAGSTLKIAQPAGTSVKIGSDLSAVTAQGRNVVLFDGAAYNWAANTGAGQSTTAAATSTLNTAANGATDGVNSALTGSAMMQGARTTNSLRIDTSAAGQSLSLNGFNLTLQQGGLLFVGANDYEISNTNATTGLKSAIATASDTVINHYGAGVLTISAPIITGTGATTFTYGGSGKAIVGNTALTAIGTYAGTTYVNGGTLQLASGLIRLGSVNTSNLTVNGGTLDLNGDSLGVGAFAGGAAAVIDNTSAAAATFIIGNGTGTGTFNGTIQNTGGALSVVKAGTGAITLGDAITGGSNTFTGNLTFTGASTLTLNSLADTAGKIDFAVAGGNLTFAGRSNLTLSSRFIDISVANGSGTLTSSSAAGSVNGTNAVVLVNTDLAPTGSGNLGFTLGGTAGNVANGGRGGGVGNGVSGLTGSSNVAVVNAFNGKIGNGTGGGTLALTVTGTGGWVLSGDNSYTGGTLLSGSGLVRATSSTAFGLRNVNVTGTAVLDLRSDTNLTLANTFSLNGSFFINVDRAIGGIGYNGIMSIGALTAATTGKTLTVTNLAGVGAQLGSSNPIGGYGLHIAGLIANVSASTATITNGLGSLSSAIFAVPAPATGVAGALVIDGVSAAANLTSFGLTIGSGANTSGVTIINGDIVQGTSTAVSINFTGNSYLTLANQTASTNYSGGLTINNATGTVRATTQYGLGTGAVTLTNGSLELRGDSSLNFAAAGGTSGNVIWSGANSVFLNVGEALNGSSAHGNTFTLGNLMIGATGAKALAVGGIAGAANASGDSVAIGGVTLSTAGLTQTVTNSLLLPGTLNLGNIITTATTGTSTLTINGAGTTLLGNVTDNGAGLLAIAYSGTGFLDLTRATGTNSYTGGLTLTSGTARATAGNNLGAGPVVFNGGTLELRADANTSFSGVALQNLNAGTLAVGPLPGGTGNGNYGVIFTLGTLTPTAAAKVLTIGGIAGTTANNGDSVTLGAVSFNNATFNTTTVTNNLLWPGLVNVAAVTNSLAATGTSTLTLNGSGVTTLGNVTDGTGGAKTAITYSGTGILDLTGATGINSYTGGLTLTSGTIRAGAGNNLGAGPVIFNAAAAILELRADGAGDFGSVQFQNLVAGTLTIGPLPGGTGNTGYGTKFTLGSLTPTAAAKVLTISGLQGTTANNGDSVILNAVNFTTAAANTTTITNNLVWPGTLNVAAINNNISTAATATNLTLNGSGVTTLFNLVNVGPGGIAGNTVAVTYSGTGILDLTGATGTNTYSGGLTLTSGLARASAANNLGGGAINFNNGTLELRADTAAGADYSASLFQNLNGGTLAIGQLPGGTGDNSYGITFKLGTLTPTAAGKNLTLTGVAGTTANNGDGVTINSVNFATSATTTVTNNLTLPGVLNLPSVNNSISAAATLATLTIAGSGVTTLGDVTNVGPGGNAGNTTAINWTGTGILDLSRATAANNYSGGLGVGSGSTVRVTNAFGLGANTGVAATSNVVTLNGGALEFRSDADINFSNTMQIAATGTPTGGINVGPLPGGTGINGSTGVNFNLGVLKVTASGKNPFIGGVGSTAAGGGDFVNFAGVDLNGIAVTLTNNLLLPSMVNFGALTSNSTTAAVALIINGPGTSLIGDVTNGASTGVGLSYSGSGFLDLSRQTVANTYTGGLTLTAGTVRVSNAFGLGAATNPVSFNGGTLELRSDTGISYPNPLISPGGGTITVGQVPGGTGNNGGLGVTFGLGSLKATVTGKTVSLTGIGGTGANSGDSVNFAGVDLNNLAAAGLANNLNLPGTLTIGSVTSNVPAATAGVAGVFTVAGVGFTTMTDVSNGTGGSSPAVVALTYGGSGILQITGSSAAANNYTGGLNLTGNGTLRTVGNFSFGASTNLISLTGSTGNTGTLDVRNDGSLSLPNPLSINSNNVTINADQATTGHLGNTLTFNNATATALGSTSKTLTLTSNSNYGITFTNGFSDAGTAWIIANNASGPVSLGAINYTAAAGSIGLSGTGLTTVGNITGATVGPALLFSGTGLADLTGNNGAANPISAVTLSGAGGILKVGAKANLGANNNTLTFTSLVTAATLQVRTDSAGTVAFGNTITIGASAALAVIDVGNAGGATTGSTIAFGALNNGAGANIGTFTINGANGYGASFTSLALPISTGQTTTVVANAPVTVSGNVTNGITGTVTGHLDTLVLDGIGAGTIGGTITDTTTGTGTVTVGNGDTRITKNGFGTWTLSGGAGTTYIGPTTVNNGVLRIGANNSISQVSNVTVNAAGANVLAGLDLNGFNQTLNNTLTFGGATSTATSAFEILLGNGTLTLPNATALNYTGTNNPLPLFVSLNGGTTGKVQLGVANGIINGTHSTSNVVSAANPYGADMIFTAPLADFGNGGVVKTGTSVLQLSSTANAFTILDIQAGTVGVASLTDTGTVKLGATTVAGTLQWVGTGGLTLNTRTLTLNGTTGGGALDNSAPGGANAVVLNSAIVQGNSGNKTLTLSGTNPDLNKINSVIADGVAVTSTTGIIKSGGGNWYLTNANMYTGGTQVQGGNLFLIGGDNRLLSGAGGVLNAVTLGSGASSGKLFIGGDAAGGTGVGTQHTQMLTQNSATSVLAASGSSLLNAVAGNADGGTSAGTPANNSTLVLNIGSGFTDVYSGLIGWDGVGSAGFQNNLNLVKNGGGALTLSADLSNWTGTFAGVNDFRPTITLNGGVLTLSGTINTAIINNGGLFVDNSIHGPNFTLITRGGLVSFDAATDTFASNNLVAASHGVASLNFNNNSITNYAGSDIFIGASGARILSSSSLSPGGDGLYRFGGGSPWNAPSTASSPGSGGYLQVATTNLVTGTHDVIIGDDGTYNSGAGIFGNLSTVEFTKPQNFIGKLRIVGGSFVFTDPGQFGDPANVVTLDGGALNSGFNATLRYGANTTLDASGRLGIVSGGTIDVGANNVTFANSLANSGGGTGGLNKIGTGTLTLTKTTAYAGQTRVSQGPLLLDLNALAGNDLILPGSAGLVMAGGNLIVKGTTGNNSRSQTFTNGTTFASGASTITPALNAAITSTPTLAINLGALTRNPGATASVILATANFVNTTVASVTQTTVGTTGTLIADANGAAYLTFGTTTASVRDWAVTDATNPQKIVQPLAAFYNTTWATAPSAAPGNSNLDVGNNNPTFTPTALGDLAYSTLRFNDNTTGTHTVSLNTFGTGVSYSLGGVLISNAITNNKTVIAGTGILQGATGGMGDFVIHNYDASYLNATGGATSSTNAFLQITSVIGGNGGLTLAGAPTALTLTTGANTYPGVTTINGSFGFVNTSIVAGVAGYFGTASADAANLVLNGGGLFSNISSGTANIGRLFSLGLNGGTLQSEAAGVLNFNGIFNGLTAIGFVGSGARTLTLQGSGGGANTLGITLGDNGGPSSLVKFGTGLWLLGANNTYTGTTSIINGQLRLAVAGGLPGGVGAPVGSLTPASTGGGSLNFAGTTTNAAVLELTSASGNFYRPVGTGLDQVQWTGNGGFAALGSDFAVNLGGAAIPTALAWGSTAGFVSTGNLDFGSVNATNKITFQNPLDLNGAATRTVQVDNGTAVNEAEFTGNLTNSVAASTAVFTKIGAGSLLLSGTNNGLGLIDTVVNGGSLVLANTAAIPGTGTGQTITTGPNGAVVIPGLADPNVLLSRIKTASTGVLAMDTGNSASLDLTNYPNLYLGAYNAVGGTPTFFSGTIKPNTTNNTYKFGSGSFFSPGSAIGAAPFNVAANILILTPNNLLSDNGATSRSAIFGGSGTQGGSGTTYLLGYNAYSGGTTIGVATGAPLSGTNNPFSTVGIGNDAALGSGNITVTGNAGLGGIGDHTLSNNITTTANVNVTLGGNLASEAIVNAGAMTYLGTVDFTTVTSGQIVSRSATSPVIILGDLKTPASANLIYSTFGALEILTTPAGSSAKTFNNGAAKGISWGSFSSSQGMLVIDSAGSFGAGPSTFVSNYLSANGINFPALVVLPGVTAPVTLNANIGMLVNATSGGTFFNVAGSPALTDSTATPVAGLVGSSELVMQGVLSGTTTGAGFQKTGLGTITLMGINTFNLTASSILVTAGTLKLDFGLATTLSGQSILSPTGTGTAPFPLSLGSTQSGALVLVGKASTVSPQPFGNVANSAKENAISVNSNGGTVNLTLGVITNANGGTLAVTTPASGSIAIGSTNTTSTNGLLVDAGSVPYVVTNGTEWGAKDASNNLVPGSSVANFYAASTSSALTAASNADMTSAATLTAASTSVASLRFNAGAAPLALGGNTLIAPGILMGSGATAGQVISGGILQGANAKNLEIDQANTASTLTISASINNNTAATALSKAGPGTLILSGTNGYTGITFFNGGVVSVATVTAAGVAGPLGAAPTAAANFTFNGGVLQYTGLAGGTTDHGAVFNNASGIDVTQAGINLTIGSGAIGVTGVASFPGILRKMGQGNLTLAGSANNTSLSVHVSSGNVILAKTNSAFAVQQTNGAGLIIDAPAGAIVANTASATQIDPNTSVIVNGGFDLNTVSLTFDGLAGSGNVKSATGNPTLTLGTANDLAISAYTLAASAAGAASTGLNSFKGTITGTIALTKNGFGTQILGGQSTYSGPTTLNAGTLKLAAGNALPAGAGAGDVTIVGNTFINGLTFPGILDMGGFDQAINGLNSSTGGFVTSSPTLGNNGTAWGVNVGSGPFSPTATTGTNTLSVSGGSASSTFNGALMDGYTVVPGAVSHGVNGVLALNKLGSGTQILSGLNTYSGGTTVTGGTLQLSGVGTLGSTAAQVALAGGTLDLGGASLTAGAVSITSATATGNALQNGSLAATSITATHATGTATITANLVGPASVTMSGAGTLTLNGAVTNEDLHASNGRVNLGAGNPAPASPSHTLNALTIDSGARVALTPGGSTFVTATSLSITGTGTFDLSNNAFVLDYPGATEDPSKTDAVGLLVRAGFHNGLWDGPGGFNTSTVSDSFHSDPGHYQYLTGIGYMSGALLGNSFLGRAIDNGSVVVRYTYYGDANLSGSVDGSDYTLIDSAYLALNDNNPATTAAITWVNGDFNSDGVIDGADYALIDTAAAFTGGQPLTSSFIAEREAKFGESYTRELASLPVTVPEPASFGLLLAGGALLGMRRRRAK